MGSKYTYYYTGWYLVDRSYLLPDDLWPGALSLNERQPNVRRNQVQEDFGKRNFHVQQLHIFSIGYKIFERCYGCWLSKETRLERACFSSSFQAKLRKKSSWKLIPYQPEPCGSSAGRGTWELDLINGWKLACKVLGVYCGQSSSGTHQTHPSRGEHQNEVTKNCWWCDLRMGASNSLVMPQDTANLQRNHWKDRT